MQSIYLPSFCQNPDNKCLKMATFQMFSLNFPFTTTQPTNHKGFQRNILITFFILSFKYFTQICYIILILKPTYFKLWFLFIIYQCSATIHVPIPLNWLFVFTNFDLLLWKRFYVTHVAWYVEYEFQKK